MSELVPRILRLEQLLGCRVDELTPAVLQRLVDERVAEDQVLEYKQQLYVLRDAGAWELGKDVAALANATGGLIIIGIREDAVGAAEVRTVPLSDGARRDMTNAIATRVTPPIPGILVTALPQTVGDGHGFYLIAVAPSAVAPHAVTDGEKLAWPVREQTQTRWMREPEIAARYRARFLGLSARDARLHDVWSEGLGGLARGAKSWMAVAITPDQPGLLRVNAQALQDTRTWLEEAQRELFHAFAATELSAGRRRFLLSDQPYGQRSVDRRLELHGDGSGFAALALDEVSVINSEPTLLVAAESVEGWLLHLTGVLSRHAVRTGAGGDVQLRAALLGMDEQSVGPMWTQPAASSSATPMQFSTNGIDVALSNSAYSMPVLMAGTRRVHEPTPVDTVISLTVALSPGDAVASAADAAGDILGEFGLPEPIALRHDGTCAIAHLNLRSATLTDWARRTGVAV